MGSLNLTPNPSVLLVQTGVLIANVVVVKKLLLDPYLKVYEKRQSMTKGSKNKASELIKHNEGALIDINKKIESAASGARDHREKLYQEAVAKRETMIGKAESDAKSIIEDAKKRVSAELQEEKNKIPQVVKKLSDELYQHTMA